MKENIIYIIQGVPLSLAITFASLIIGFLLAVLFVSILSISKNGIVSWIVKLFITFFTGTPLLIQISLIYYGPNQFEWVRNSPMIVSLLQAWVCAILALSLNSAAYTSLLFKGALDNISEQQWQASYALGLTKVQAFKVNLSLALRRALPSYSNEIILVFKSTSLVAVITLLDIMGRTTKIFGETWDPSYFIVAGVIYLIINSVLIIFAKLIEKKALAFES